MTDSVMQGTPGGRQAVKLLVFGGSMRQQSLNCRLAKLAASVLEGSGAAIDWAHFSEFECPTYDGDVEDTQGLPPGALELCRRLDEVDGFVIASPEYNASMPGALKNVIDWASRRRPQPFNQKHCLLMSASPSMVGGNRGLWSLRIPLEHLGARVYPEMFSLATAHEQLDEQGRITDPMLSERFEQTLVAWLDQVEASTHYPCAKARWVEFLGEHAAASIDRVE